MSFDKLTLKQQDMLGYLELILGHVRSIEFDSPIAEELIMTDAAIMEFQDMRCIMDSEGKYAILPRRNA